ncbi:hypothetical protein MCETE7_00461 [Acidimicrobiia bacterium]
MNASWSDGIAAPGPWRGPLAGSLRSRESTRTSTPVDERCANSSGLVANDAQGDKGEASGGRRYAEAA